MCVLCTLLNSFKLALDAQSESFVYIHIELPFALHANCETHCHYFDVDNRMSVAKKVEKKESKKSIHPPIHSV